MNKIENIANNFNIEGKLIEIKELGGGNINRTFLLTFFNQGSIDRYIFQRINTTVFNEPHNLMQRIEQVTTHMKNKQTNGAQVLQVIKTNENNTLHVINDNGSVEYWRVYEQIKDAISYNDMSEVPSGIKEEVSFKIGQAFGNFLKLVSDYPEDGLKDPIDNFHNTEYIYQEFLKDVQRDPVKRVANCQDEIDFVIQREKLYYLLNELHKKGLIPKRLNHNDTKINNVLICWETNCSSVIDLDTVMPGMLSDPADALRSLINEAGEEVKDLSLIEINFDILKSFIEGYASETYNVFNEIEINNIGNALHIISLELGMRFLNDYINGDVYFRVNPKIQDHNLQRAKVQFQLAKKIEQNKKTIEEVIYSVYANAKNQEKAKQYILDNKKSS